MSLDAMIAEPANSHQMLGMRLDHVSPDKYLPAIVAAAGRGEAFYCCVSNVHMCVLSHDDAAFRAVVNGARYVIPDSTILEKARALRHGVSSAETLRGAEMMLALCERAALDGVPIGLVGGRDDAVLAELMARLKAKMPMLNIAYAFSPPFAPMSADEDDAMVADIRTSGARLIFVGLGCPKQERWMNAHTARIDGGMVGVGAAFDFNAGVVKTSPTWVHRWGLEWLYRLVSEPRRLWKRYLTTSPRFLWLLALDAGRAD